MKNNELFGLNASIWVDEFFAMVQPMTTLIFRPQTKNYFHPSYKVDETHIRKIFLPKTGKGKWGNEANNTILDYLWYSFAATIMFPYLLRYKKILIRSPPFFNGHLVPLLRIFGRDVYLIINDEQLPLHKVNVLKQLYYKLVASTLEWISVKFSTKTFATSQYLYEKYKKYKKEVYYTPNGADVDTIEKIKQKRMFNEFTITYIGGFELWRGIDMLIKAFLDIKRKTKRPMKLLLIGNGPDFDAIKKAANNDPDVVFTSYLAHDDAIAYSKGSDILVMPSRKCLAAKTISSIKCFEYIASGIPTIVTDSGEHTYWIKKFGAGLVVKDSKEDLERGIVRLMRDKDLYNRIKNNCKKNRDAVDYKIMRKAFVEEVLK